MNATPVNLVGQLCPFPVMHIVRAADHLQPGQSAQFLVDDPLAIKSVPEELEDFPDVRVQVEKRQDCWMIMVERLGR